MYEDWLHCLHRRRCKTRFEICKNADEELSDIRAIRIHSVERIMSSRPMNYVMFHHRGGDTEECVTQRRSDTQREYTHYIWGYTYSVVVCGSSTRSMFHCKSWIVTKGKERKEENHAIFFTHNDADKAEEFTDLKKLRKVNSKIHWRSEQNAEHWILLSATQKTILADSVYAIITYLSMLKEFVVKVVNKSEDENYSQDNLCLERTRSDTPKHWGSWRLRRLMQFLGNRDQNCRCGTLTQLHQRVAIGRTRNYKDEKYMQKNHTRTTVWVRRPRRKFMKQAIASCIRQHSRNSLQMPAENSKELGRCTLM